MTIDDAQTMAALRQLDPASGRGDPALAMLSPAEATLSQAEARRAALALERIIAVDPAGGADHPAPAPGLGGRRSHRRWAWMAAGALIVAGALVVPGLVDGDRAYASWTPVPVALSPTERAAAARACLDSLDQVADPGVVPLLAERRGGWTYVLVRPGDRLQSSCLRPTAEIGDDAAGDRGRWFGSTDEERPEPAPEADLVRVDTAATGGTEEGLFSWSEGAVGRDVVGIVVTTPRGVRVTASVANGHYAVWWPAGTNDIDSPEISEASQLDVTLTDGSTYRRGG